MARVKALLGAEARFTLEWASVYTFACLRMEKFRVGRVLFAGDAAHGVSPFGARGANSGVQDADNLGWKLAAVLREEAPDRLLDSYADEREYAADENIPHSTRATDFITPKSEVSRLFRDAVLALAKEHAFARSLVTAGACRCRPRSTAPRSTRRMSMPSPARCGPARRLRMRRCATFGGGGTRRPPGASRRARLHAADLRSGGVGRRLARRGTGPCARSRCSTSRCAGKPMASRMKTLPDASPRATTRAPVAPGCCAPTSMSAHAGASRPRLRYALLCNVRSAMKRRDTALRQAQCERDGDRSIQAGLPIPETRSG